MSTPDNEQQDPETAERPFLIRTFEAELTAGDGRTVDVRIVPYGETARVSDDRGRTFYREQWEPGAFDDQLVAGHRLKVLLNFEHLGGIPNIIGKGVALRSQPDGLHGSFRMSETQDGDKALELVRDGILDSVSLEAFPKVNRTVEGVVRRVKAHLHNVALCRQGAFASAKVLAVREQAHTILDEDLLPVDLNPVTVKRLRDRGIVLPDRYKAHPEAADTPAESGTSEDGTRPSEENGEFQEV